jgi:tape measure domain-containing protein
MAENVQYILSLKDLFSQTIRNANSEADKFESKVNGLQGSLTKLAGLAAAAFSLNAIKDFGMSVVETGAKFEKTEIGLSTLLKSTEKGHEAFEQIKKDAATTPFGIDSLLLANKALIGTGLDAKTAQKDVLNLSNAIAATGGGDDELGRMSVNLQQIRNVGKATAMDIKEFAFAGINIYELLAQATGKTAAETKDMEVSYDLLAYALQKAHDKGGIYANGLENLSKTTAVQIGNIGDEMLYLKDDIFQALKPQIDSVIKSIGGFIDSMRDGVKWMQENVTVVKTLGVFIVSLTVGILAYNTAVFIATNYTTAWTLAQIALNIAMGATPIGLVIIGIAAFAAGIYYAWQKSEQFRGTILGIWEVIKTLGSYIGDNLMPFINTLGSAASTIGNAFKTIFGDIKDAFMELFTPIYEGIKWLLGIAGKASGGTGLGALFSKGYAKGISPIGITGDMSPISITGDMSKFSKARSNGVPTFGGTGSSRS